MSNACGFSQAVLHENSQSISLFVDVKEADESSANDLARDSGNEESNTYDEMSSESNDNFTGIGSGPQESFSNFDDHFYSEAADHDKVHAAKEGIRVMETVCDANYTHGCTIVCSESGDANNNKIKNNFCSSGVKMCQIEPAHQKNLFQDKQANVSAISGNAVSLLIGKADEIQKIGFDSGAQDKGDQLKEQTPELLGKSSHTDNVGNAKNTLETQVLELQTRLHEQLKMAENLMSHLADRNEHCSKLERKQESLEHFIELLRDEVKVVTADADEKCQTLQDKLNEKIADCKEMVIAQASIEEKVAALKSKVEKTALALQTSDQAVIQENKTLRSQNSDMRQKLKSDGLLLRSYVTEIQRLNHENTELKLRLRFHEEGFGRVLTEADWHTIMPLIDQRVAQRLGDLEYIIGEHDQLQTNFKVLERENETLRESVQDYERKCTEALATLKEVHDTYGETREAALEDHRRELAELQASFEASNRDIVDKLESKILDSQSVLERERAANKEERERLTKEVTEEAARCRLAFAELDSLREKNLELQGSIAASEELSKERLQQLAEVRKQVSALNDKAAIDREALASRELEVSRLNVEWRTAEVARSHEQVERARLEKEVLVIESLKLRIERLKDETEALKNQMKVKSVKAKYMKQQMKDVLDQKEKAESALSVLPEMRKRLDESEERVRHLRQQIADAERYERERLAKIEREKREAEERARKEKEDWELRTLGIGKCTFLHDGELLDESELVVNVTSRPSSAPLKPSPPSSSPKRVLSAYGQRKFSYKKGSNLNPAFIDSYPEGRRTSQKMISNKEKYNASLSKDSHVSSKVTKDSHFQGDHSFSSESLNYADDYVFPRLRAKVGVNGSHPPRVLVWGDNQDGPGKRLVAVGDQVLVAVQKNCDQHGKMSHEVSGVVKYIGFISGNDKDVYLGLRLEDAVGNTDGRVQGKRYFRCEPRMGQFVRLTDIVKVLDSAVVHAP